jgi:ribonuclease-3
LLAAIYLDADKNGKTVVGEFLMPFIYQEIKDSSISGETVDYKTMLQQFTQQSDGELPEYVEISQSGPDHMKRFEVEVKLNNNVIGRGVGKTKKAAEQNAAAEACKLFELK